MFTGPEGTGKQRLALWLAQSVLCAESEGPACGRCPECRLVLDLAHPDLHWFVPIPRPKAAETSKQVDEVKLALGEVMAERRDGGRWTPGDGTTGHWLASVRLLQRVAALTPFRSRRKILILGDAERLVVQEANLEAANALLKVLEEPPADTTIVLTAAESSGLLPTIRSRVVPMRVGRVPDDVVREYATRELGTEERGTALERVIAAADGRIGRLLAAGAAAGPVRQAQALLDAAAAGAEQWSVLALSQPPWGARGEFADMLAALAMELRARVRRAAEAGDREGAGRHLAAIERVESVRDTLGTNVNPQLALAELARALERAA